jgi:hypothetical protein
MCVSFDNYVMAKYIISVRYLLIVALYIRNEQAVS